MADATSHRCGRCVGASHPSKPTRPPARQRHCENNTQKMLTRVTPGVASKIGPCTSWEAGIPFCSIPIDRGGAYTQNECRKKMSETVRMCYREKGGMWVENRRSWVLARLRCSPLAAVGVRARAQCSVTSSHAFVAASGACGRSWVARDDWGSPANDCSRPSNRLPLESFAEGASTTWCGSGACGCRNVEAR